MKQVQHTILPTSVPTLSAVLRWRDSLLPLHLRLAPHFARPEPYARALRFVQAMLSSVERKNGWQVAEQAREATPYGLQRLLSQAKWDEDGVRDAVRTLARSQLGTREAIVASDETSFPQRGSPSAGIKKQYCGTTGHVQNCQVGVLLSSSTQAGHTLIDREGQLPQDWTDDPARCQQAGIPALLPFRTKPELAIQMLARLHRARVPLCWVVADSVYGGHLDLRLWLEAHQSSQVGALACDDPGVLQTSDGQGRRLEVRDVLAWLASTCWQTLAMNEGTKGPRLFDFACVPLWHQGRDDGWHSLRIRRPRDPTAELTDYLVFAPPATRLEAKVSALGARWRIEEDFEHGKDLGLDHYEVRSCVGWYRHITLVLLALAQLSSIAAAARQLVCSLALEAESKPFAIAPPDLELLSVPEARHLLARLLFPLPASVPLVLQWSAWRRRHQRLARLLHIRRRRDSG